MADSTPPSTCICKGLLALVGRAATVIAVDLGAFLVVDHGRGNHGASSLLRQGQRRGGCAKCKSSVSLVRRFPRRERHAPVESNLTPYPPDATPVTVELSPTWPHVSTNHKPSLSWPIMLLRFSGCCGVAATQQHIETQHNHNHR